MLRAARNGVAITVEPKMKTFGAAFFVGA